MRITRWSEAYIIEVSLKDGLKRQVHTRAKKKKQMSTINSQESVITLKGSTELVAQFFHYGINSILYQRGIYPAETFKQEVQYGLNMVVTDDEKLDHFLSTFLKQLSDWASKCQVQKVVLVITGVESKEVLERWVFDVQTPILSDSHHTDQESTRKKVKARKEIVSEIQAVIRQITASVSFLPLLNEPSSFDLLVYTNKDSNVPALWEESDPRYVNNSAQVRLRSFNTNVHKIDAFVAYKNPDDDSV
uniref:Mitotic spindle checkpoint component mad2 putative n=1 Tax=Albugo laibachii Nc14 TaxID=890382 RepID=F0W6L4_9STRA|nr:mitotic spindle checkpoint component mad2 putative [Albugo laibachii Nc14]|eukprot:CCA16759.1 mitotic spindle checkpoint component mad2 putative [Albugo laibachii Nc14]